MGTARDLLDLLFGDAGDFDARVRLWSARRAKVCTSTELVVGRRGKIVGVARSVESALVAPFSQRPALAYRTAMLQKHLTTDHHGREVAVWKQELRELAGVPFTLEDESGSVLVDARQAELGFADEDVMEHPHVNDDNPSFRAYLRSRGILSTMYMGIAGDHRFLEAIISPGDRVGVWGLVIETSGVASAGYRDAAAGAKMMTGDPVQRCVILRG